MISDTALRSKGMKTLAENLGLLETERFIALILREPFNYTEWRNELFKDVPLNTFLTDAMEYRRHIDAKKQRG